MTAGTGLDDASAGGAPTVEDTTVPVAAAPVHQRRADIQGLRALAVVLVVAYHAGLPVSGGFVGVDMFFVISGFVITGMLLAELESSATVRFSAFYTRRIRRLLPALSLLVVFTAVASALLLSPVGPQRATAKTGIGASLFSANLQLWRAGGNGYFDLTSETNALLHTWSLSVEEQFYLAFPVFLLLAWRLATRFGTPATRRRIIGAAVTVASLVSFALCVRSTPQPGKWGQPFAFYSPFTRAWEFGVGALLALGVPLLIRRGSRLGHACAVAGLALVAFAAFRFSDATSFPGTAALVPVVGAALLLVAGTITSTGFARALSVRPAMWFGDVSYGWYLWHWPLIVFTVAMWPGALWLPPVAALVALGPTWLSYRWVENPIRFNERLTGRRIVPLFVVCVALPLLACAGLLSANTVESRRAEVKKIVQDTRLHDDLTRGCSTTTPIGERPKQGRCTWAVPNPKGTIYLVGDSNAGHFTEPVAAAGNRLGYDVTVATLSSCPFADLVYGDSRDATVCHEWVMDSVEALKRERPALVIIASSSSRDLNLKVPIRDPHSGARSTTTDGKAPLWEDGIARVLAELGGAGVPTLVIHTIPHFGNIAAEWRPEACPAIRIFTDSCPDGSISAAALEEQQRPAREAERRAIAQAPLAKGVDLTPDICPTDPCTSAGEPSSRFNDASHLSVDGAVALTDRIEQMLAERLEAAG